MRIRYRSHRRSVKRARAGNRAPGTRQPTQVSLRRAAPFGVRSAKRCAGLRNSYRRNRETSGHSSHTGSSPVRVEPCPPPKTRSAGCPNPGAATGASMTRWSPVPTKGLVATALRPVSGLPADLERANAPISDSRDILASYGVHRVLPQRHTTTQPILLTRPTGPAGYSANDALTANSGPRRRLPYLFGYDSEPRNEPSGHSAQTSLNSSNFRWLWRHCAR